MLSSVSIDFLGMCAGMWVISTVFILGCKSRSFISVSPFQRSFFSFFVFDFSYFVCALFLRFFCFVSSETKRYCFQFRGELFT